MKYTQIYVVIKINLAKLQDLPVILLTSSSISTTMSNLKGNIKRLFNVHPDILS